MNQPLTQLATPATAIDSQLIQAVGLQQTGEFTEARAIYESILANSPNHFDATHLLGIVALQQGDFARAQSLIQRAIRINPGNVAAANNLATAYLNDGQLECALEAARGAQQLAPSSFEVLLNVGTILHQMNCFREAIEPLRQANLLAPHSTTVANLLGACLLKTDDPRAAASVYESSATMNPNDADVWANLSVAQNALGQHQRALESANRALSLQPSATHAMSALAAAQFEMGQLDDAIATYRRAVEMMPAVPTLTLCAFANALITSGLHTDALQQVRRALEVQPDHTTARWLYTMAQIMPMYENRVDIDESRVRFADSLKALQAWYRQVQPAEAFRAVGATQPFYLAYQPFNNRDLLRCYGEVCVDWMKSMAIAPRSARGKSSQHRKIRVGLASTHMRNHSVWVAVAKGWVENLNKSEFEISLFHLSLQSDKETQNARRHADHFEDQATDVFGWVEAIQRAELDVLIYPAIGMDPLSSQLASLRLAPVQVTTWGHPETSGLETIDYYLSGESLEPANAQGNYTEQLIQLPNLSVMVEPLRPKMVDPSLDAIGLPRNQPLLLCPGSPFKYSPLDDWVWV
jgi:protein O-GlcNAc transferase